jgi:hypothetical protein
VTQQYLAGELSLLLAALQETTADPVPRRWFAELRREAETAPVGALGPVAQRALQLNDALCYESLARSDSAAFRRQCAAGAELYEFGICAGLIDEE